MKKTIEVDDTLSECVQAAKDEVTEALHEWLDENFDRDEIEADPPELYDTLDYSGRIHEIIDGCVPVYTHEIDTAHFLYGNNLEEAYENAGLGDKSETNWKAVAIFCYIEQEINEWWEAEAQTLTDEWVEDEHKDTVWMILNTDRTDDETDQDQYWTGDSWEITPIKYDFEVRQLMTLPEFGEWVRVPA